MILLVVVVDYEECPASASCLPLAVAVAARAWPRLPLPVALAVVFCMIASGTVSHWEESNRKVSSPCHCSVARVGVLLVVLQSQCSVLGVRDLFSNFTKSIGSSASPCQVGGTTGTRLSCEGQFLTLAG
jgi:hypothetical protein